MTDTNQSSVRGILLDIEGTTSSISFVHDVMFPYVLQRLDQFIAEHFSRPDVRAAGEQIAKDAGHESLDGWASASGQQPSALIIAEVQRLMAQDAKATGLKALQGLIWDGGFRSGQLVAHVFPDVIPTIKQWRQSGLDVRIYSSGSIAAQKLFFGHLAGEGDCLALLSGHYDTTIGGKKESESYRRVAQDWGLAPEEILFVSDIAGELQAAQEAGLQVRASTRPGNTELPVTLDVPRITSFAQIIV